MEGPFYLASLAHRYGGAGLVRWGAYDVLGSASQRLLDAREWALHHC